MTLSVLRMKENLQTFFLMGYKMKRSSDAVCVYMSCVRSLPCVCRVMEHSYFCVGMCTAATGAATWPHTAGCQGGCVEMSSGRTNGGSQLSSWIS